MQVNLNSVRIHLEMINPVSGDNYDIVYINGKESHVKGNNSTPLYSASCTSDSCEIIAAALEAKKSKNFESINFFIVYLSVYDVSNIKKLQMSFIRQFFHRKPDFTTGIANDVIFRMSLNSNYAQHWRL